jgi:hypothetical protein
MHQQSLESMIIGVDQMSVAVVYERIDIVTDRMNHHVTIDIIRTM